MYNRRPQQGSYEEGGGGNGLFMTVASSIVGAIIGRGGSRIREMEETSGARIKIHDNDNNDSGERRIEISGSPQNQDAAKAMIEQVIDGTYQDEYGGGGGGGRYGGGGGGRYGGGGGGGGGGGSCFKCGEPGHFARDCPSGGGGGGGMRGGGRSFGRGGGGGGGGGGNCFKCGESGHFARECSSSDSYSGGGGGSRGGSRW